MMKDIRYFNDYAGEDGYIIVDSIEGEIPGGKKKLSELGVNAYEVVSATGDDDHPDVDPRDASTKILYIVETGTEDTTYIPWIWTLGESAEYQWKQLGSKPLPDNSWKQWSEDKGSSSLSDESVYIGQSNRIERDDTYVLGKGNIVTSTDNSQDYSDTDVVSIGKNNTTQDGANVYQLGRDNTVIGNNLGNKDYYPNSMAVNIGRDNIINTPNSLDLGGEGINIGKLNTAQGFGINIGQNNTAKNVSIAIGENRHADGTNALSIGFDKKSYDIDLYDVNSLKYGNDYYPIGEYTPIKLSDTGRLVKYAAFDSTTHLPVEVKRYSVVYNEETGKVTFYESTDTRTIYGYLTETPIISSLDRTVGYLDGDNIISSKSAPSGQTVRTYYRYYWYDYGNEPSESTKNSRAIIGTNVETIYIDPTKFAPNNWVAYNYSDYAQYLIPSDKVKINVYITNERMFAGNTGRDTLCSIRITGKEVDGKFIPWFNDNFPKSECTTRDFDPRSIFTKSYYANELKEKYNFYLSPETCHKNLNEVQDGAKAIGSLINVDYGGFGIASEYNQSLWVSLTDKFVADDRTGTEYYYDNGSIKTNNYAITCVTDTKVLTPSGLLDKFCTTVNSGAFGINAGRSTGSKPGALFANGGAIAIGNNLTVDNGGIGIGVDNGKIGCGSVAIGVNNFSPNCAGTLMIANNTTYRSGYNNSKDEIYNYGSSIFGTGNYLQNTHSGATVLGNYNAVGDTGPAYGSIAMGNYNCIKGSGAVSIGRGATAKYGALSISCGIGDTYPGCGGTFATDGSIALGYKGIYSQAGSLSMGYNGVFSIYGSFAIGYNDVSAFDSSFAIGHEGSYARDRSVSIGIGGVCAHNQSYAFGRAITSISNSMSIGFAGVNSYSGALAIGSSGVVSVYDSVAIGLQGVKGSNGSFAAGRGGTTAFYTSTAYGSGAFATNYSTALSINSYLTYSGSDVFKNSDFFYFTGRNYDCTGYVDVKLSGITRVYGYKTETVRGVITYVEDSSGSLYLYKTPTGKYYENLEDIPYEDYNVAIRGHIDENNRIIPFLGAKADVMGDIEIPDTWVNVTWGSNSDQVQVRKSAVPTDFLTCGATNNSMILGDSSYAGYGSLAIAQSAGSDNRQFYYNRSNWSSGGEYGKIITTHAGNEFTKDGKQYLRTFRAFESMATNLSIAIGTSSRANNASLSFGYFIDADNGSMALGYGGKDKPNMYGQAKNNSLLISGLGNPTDDKNPRGSSSNKSIAIGTANTANNQSISIGDENIADRNAFAFGTKNTSYGWSIALGVHNTSYNGPGGHATMIGQYNTSTSNQEVIHKEYQGDFIPGVPYVPAEIELSQVSQYRTAVHDALATGLTSSELAIFDSYYSQYEDWGLGRTDNYPYASQEMNDISNHLKTVPPYNLTTEDKATLVDIFSSIPPYNDWEAMKAFYISIFEIASKYDSLVTTTFIQGLRNTNSEEESALFLNNHPEMNDPLTKSYESARYEGEPIQGKLTQEQYNIFASNEYSLRDLLRQIRRKIDASSEGHYEIIEDDVVCNSFLVGNNNTSNHYNSILIGALNESQVPQVQPDPTYHTTDDDGFMIAVGYRNVVGRNYDMAIGHRSKAIGGENVALQHSEAEGYRNFAAFDSNVHGTANVLLGESTLIVPWEEDPEETLNKHNAATHNLMFNSLSEHTTSPTGGYMQNVLLDVDLVTNTKSVTENFIYGGAGHENNTKVELTAGTAVTGNVILGSQHGSKPLQVTCTNAIVDNIISHPSSIIANASYAFHRNILIGQKRGSGDPEPIMNITGAETIIKNIVIHGSIIGKAKAFTNNIVLSDSQIESTYDQGDGGCVTNNILLNNAQLVNTNVETWWAGRSLQPCTDNIVVGANVSDSINSVIISDSGNGAQISDALRIFNFGDNSAMHVAEGRVFGGKNTIQCAKKFFISGDQNTIASTAVSMGTTNGANSLTTIFGSNNSVTSTPDADYSLENTRNTIFGCFNTIRGSLVADNTVFGSCNQIGSSDTDYNITECFVSGSDNLISSKVNAFTILGKSNSVQCNGGPSGNKLWAIGNGFVQGNDNHVYFGSNTIAMGNGNTVEGHNGVAIGCQLKASQWQTVIGKYNLEIEGPNRLTSENPNDPTKALFIIGNGHSTTDRGSWRDETNITRSNALEVYADGHMKVSGNVEAANIPAPPSSDGQYALNCTVSNGVVTYAWVPVGTTTTT